MLALPHSSILLCSALNAVAGAYAENLPLIIITGGPNTNDFGSNRLVGGGGGCLTPPPPPPPRLLHMRFDCAAPLSRETRPQLMPLLKPRMPPLNRFTTRWARSLISSRSSIATERRVRGRVREHGTRREGECCCACARFQVAA